MKTAEHQADRPVVLIIAAHFPPAPQSGAMRPSRFAKYLPLFGYDVVVICQAKTGQALESSTVRRVPRAATGLIVRLDAKMAHYFQRYFLPYDDNLPWVTHATAEAEAVLSERPVAVILSTSPPIATHLAARIIHKRHRIPWVADFRDPLQGNPFRSRRWAFPYDAIMERKLFHDADALIANTDTVANMWRKRHVLFSHKVSTIWNGFDPDDQCNVELTKPGSRKILTHVGSLYGGRHPGKLFNSMVRLIKRGDLGADQVAIRLVGPYEDQCISINQNSVDTLRLWGCLDADGKQVVKEEARQAGAGSDFLLLLDLNTSEAELQVPAKVFEYIQYGRPILVFTRRGSPTDRILNQSGVPYRAVYHDYSDAEVDTQVLSIFNLQIHSSTTTKEYNDAFNCINQTRSLAEILDSVRCQA